MREVQTIKFVLPKFQKPEGYNADGLFDIVSEIKAIYPDDEQRILRLRLIAKRYPWLANCLPQDAKAGIVNDIKAEELRVDEVTKELCFREIVTHVDGSTFGNRLSTLRTSTPTTFIACAITGSNPMCPSSLSNGEISQTMPPQVNDYIYFGLNWLEQYLGHAPLIEKARGTIRDFIDDINDLEIVQADPGYVADGLVEETLHTASQWHPPEPTTSVIFRAIYTHPAEPKDQATHPA